MQTNNTLTRAVRDWCAHQQVELAGKTVLCAVSGGRDSMALLHVLLELGGQEGFAVAVAHYNHNLRENAVRDELLVFEHCTMLGLPFYLGGGDVRAYAKTHGTSIEDAARTMRYEFLQNTAKECGADYIATAHHRQDNAETLLLHLLRGSGLQGLGGIAPVRGNIIRPLLAVDRAEIDNYIITHNIAYTDDETNQDTVYARNRLRHELLPLLEEIAPGSVGRIADTAQRLRADEEFFRQYCAEILPRGAEIPTSLLRREHPAVATRLVRSAAREFGVELTAVQTEAVLAMRRGACLSLGGGVRVAHEGETLRFFRLREMSEPMELAIGEHDWGAWRVSVYETSDEVAENAGTLVLRGDAAALTIAAWDGTGRLGVENGSRTVKRLLADHRIGAAQRENCPAIYAGGKLAAVFGAGTDIDFRPVPGEIKIVIAIKNLNK